VTSESFTAICVHCALPIEPAEVRVGAGDGSGQKFAHQVCFFRHLVGMYKQALTDLIEEAENIIGFDDYPKCESAMFQPSYKYAPDFHDATQRAKAFLRGVTDLG
jgi:hypothetical protein